MRKTLVGLAICSLATPALALEPVSDTAGWGGKVRLGAGAGSVETNFYSEILGFDLGDDKIDKLDSPDDDDIALPVAGFEVSYTFDSTKTAIVLNRVDLDPLAFESAVQLGVRHEFDSLGTMQISGLSTAGVSLKAYADPYQEGTGRKDTDLDSGGFRFVWDKMFGSNFEVDAVFRDRNVDDEDSGVDLGLTQAERKLLDRQGDVVNVSVGYVFNLEGGKHMIRPHASYLDYDLDGDAMSQDGFEVGVAYTYTGDKVKWANKLSYASLDGDKSNPIFNDTNDADRVIFASNLMFPGAFGWKKWVPAVTVAYADEDSDVDFNDSSLLMVSASLGRRF